MVILMGLGICAGGFIGIIILYLAIVIFAPGFHVPKQPLPVAESKKEPEETPRSRKDVSFEVDGDKIHAWLYLPGDLSKPVPCVVMGNGFGGTKDMILENYAILFQVAGLAALAIDFRFFGESEGQPRQLYTIGNQIKDFKAAIAYARGLAEIDPDRIATWGTSASGGYGLIVAARDKKIACVVGQCPALDSQRDGRVALKREGWGFFLRLFMHAQRNTGRGRLGLSPHKVPLVGKPGTLAMVTGPGAFEGYTKLASRSFVNEVCARAILMSHDYNPFDYAKDVECPVLILSCEQDNLVSKESAVETAKVLGEYAELKQYPIGHFEIYEGEHFKRSITDQIAFFEKHLN